MSLPTVKIVSSPVTALPFNEQIEHILKWANEHLSKTVCVANVHMLIEAHWQKELCTVLENSDLVTPDGMPLVWMMKLLGVRKQNRVAGMDILVALCQQAPERNVSIFFVGSETEILEAMRVRLKREFPHLQIAGMEPLPFRPMTPEEDEALIQKVNDSQAGIVAVSLGCPKQEYWMGQHKGKIQSVMIGLGGVFPVYAGIHKRAPFWVREMGLEWLYRLVQEPRRLWKRYTKTIPPFVWLALKQLIAQPKSQSWINGRP
ncbi:WecB/TagA/CpsF family glycosyltransferase [Oculatella sp. LEGE 06141]|uniref:WecB/TagA/CpsF family glycosyltransferase n=1 Tax=Oculatella sp. LEGE 06141 TaxID=1828648 RepID=UPI0018822450|nr:WecB/TagA/CpsF family glycosyltransferase [Oculatella sp. LEGE 06141]MBE9178843.1 WecB/TagA/CpsF family glycosyltransferase [Oculatella sp. LEGE 06141]